MPSADRRPALSIVVPVYDEEGNVEPLHAELAQVAAAVGRPYEIVFVNDGSSDGTLARLEAILQRDPCFRVVDLDGNFGEAGALSAGFAHAEGEVVVTLDGDGQNDPADIPKLLARLDDTVDAVSGRRLKRKEQFMTRVLPSLVANRMIALFTGVPVYDCGCGLKAYRRELVAGAQLPRGMNRFLPAILGVDARRVAEIETRDRPRGSGSSHYGLSRLFTVFRDLPSLPFLVRRPSPGHATVRTLAIAAGVLGVLALLALVRAGVTAALGLGLAAAAAAAARHNVARWTQAREHGVFRVRRVLHGTPTSAHRDRRRGLLGQEPAPDLRPSVHGARH